MIKKPLSLFLALTAGAVLTTNAAPAAQSGSAAPKPAVPAGPTGTITWKGVAPQRSMLYVQKDNKLQPKSFAKDGTLTLPVGDYTIVYMNCQIDDCNVSVNYGPKAPKITVAEGKPVELEAIAAAAMKVTAGAKSATGEIALSLALTTADGIKLTCQNAKDPNAKPGFRILDAAGKEVAKGSFEFGWGGTCAYTWRVPQDLKGEYTIEPNLGVAKPPFKLTSETTKITL